METKRNYWKYHDNALVKYKFQDPMTCLQKELPLKNKDTV